MISDKIIEGYDKLILSAIGCLAESKKIEHSAELRQQSIDFDLECIKFYQEQKEKYINSKI